MIRTLLALSLVLTGLISARAQQTIFGKVIDESGEPVINGAVAVYNGSSLVTGTVTDLDGNYRINLDPGTYNVEFSYIGYSTRRINDFVVLAGRENQLNLQLEAGVDLAEILVTEYKIPPMTVDETTQGAIITSDEVRKLGSRSINAIAGISAGATSADENSAVSIRGARTDATQYIIDGIRVTGNALVPETEIDQIQVITGGVEAKYGDLSGGIISITTKGPSSEYRAYVEAETSSFLDPYNNNLVGLNVSGPLLSRTLDNGRKQSLLGFRLSGRYTYNQNDDPPATPVYYLTDSARVALEANPVIALPGGGILQRAAFLTPAMVQTLDAEPFEALDQIDITGKLDARLNDAMDITLSGTYRRSNDQFTPGAGAGSGASWRLLNAHNNPFDLDNTVRGNLRFRHRLGSQGAQLATGSDNLISNAFYTIQLGWQRGTQLLQDPRHKDRFFDYGYVGQFDFSSEPTYTPVIKIDSFGNLDVRLRQEDYRINFNGFTPGTQNPVLARYNFLGGSSLDGVRLEDYPVTNGVQSTLVSDGVYTFHTNIGQIYNQYNKTQNDLITFNLQAQFDLQPGGSDKGNHNVQVGFLAEQRINRNYRLNPRGLWLLADQLANGRLSGLDTNAAPIRQVAIDTVVLPFGRIQQTVDIYPYATTAAGGDERFYDAIRRQLGLAANERVNVQGLTPDQLSLDLFSAPELTNDDIVDYYGYDYLGNQVGSNFAWEDFFTAKDADGIRTFPVAPVQPIYFSGYLQDKFTFRDIILRAGVRVDYFDANTKVLKDPYELYDIQTVENFEFNDDTNNPRPANIPDGAKVYLESEGSKEVKAYRVDDTWFTASGRQVNRAAEIFTTTQIPAYVDTRASSINNYIQSDEFDPNASFKDYEAQINVMPRLAFSFPISEKANFFAHYDVLVQRPPSNTVATAIDYFYFTKRAGNSVFNNPNLKPTRTVDYEAGFQTRISAASALKLSFFVREMRDMIQRRTYLFAVGEQNQYSTYDNQDFGTVKGVNVSYDLRRTGPFQMRLSYGLQFADGTGSDVNSQRGSAARGNLRTLYPLSFDERHRVSGSVDYRYGRGEGPEILGKQIFENMGINLFGSTVSGRPYTRLLTPTALGGRVNEGDINGARLPWNVALNLRVDRDFTLFPETNGNRGVLLNAYLRVSNLLDRRNIISVYPASGQPNDDGFLASPLGQNVRDAQVNEEAYIQLYNYRLLNPDFYSLPRRIFVGASFSF